MALPEVKFVLPFNVKQVLKLLEEAKTEQPVTQLQQARSQLAPRVAIWPFLKELSADVRLATINKYINELKEKKECN
jgi:uncharacterized protein involved in exopolysaccharide biosynthesis